MYQSASSDKPGDRPAGSGTFSRLQRSRGLRKKVREFIKSFQEAKTKLVQLPARLISAWESFEAPQRDYLGVGR